MSGPAPAAPPLEMPVTHIRASGAWRVVPVGELWRYRDLLVMLVIRDLKIRYKQTYLGVAWAVGQPLISIAIFSVVFGRIGGLADKIPSGLPYPLFVMAGLIPWQLFAYSLGRSATSMVAEQRLLTKVYFPRILVPLASTLSGLVDFAVTFAVLLAGMAWYGYAPGWPILLLPVFAVLVIAAALSAGLWLSALNVQYRDVQALVAFLTQVWMYLTPIIYPASAVPPEYRALLALNPMSGIVEGFRWAVLGTVPPDAGPVVVSVVLVGLLLATGLLYFRRTERIFADVV